jgi:hypothetical protein
MLAALGDVFPEIVVDGSVGEPPESYLANEAARGGSHHDTDLGSGSDEAAGQSANLVGGYTAGDGEQHALSS